MILATCERIIAAPLDLVWELVSTAEGLGRWMAVEATVELRPGGAIRWVHDNGWVVAGEIREVVPPTRLVFSYGWERGGFPVPVGSSDVTIELTPEPSGVTRFSVRHRGLPSEEEAERHTGGWALFADRLVVAATGSP